MADVPPNQTIYVNNMYEKLSKTDLKKCLYAMFSQFGKIVDVVVMKTYRLRGQAWIVFADISAATSALRALQGFPFFDKPMRLSYAKGKSDAIAKLDGTYKVDKAARQKQNETARENLMSRGKAKAAAPAAAGGVQAAPAAPAGSEQLAANKILFVQNLPEASNSQMLTMLFQQFPGFKEVRMVDARPGIAFVEYENDMQASVAMQGLQGFKITPTNSMQITYAKQ